MALRSTLGDLQHDCAMRFTDRPFITIAETGRTLSYIAFEQLTNRLAHQGIRDHFGEGLDYAAIVMRTALNISFN